MNFGAYHVATVLDGRAAHNFAQDGEVSVWRDGQTYIYDVPSYLIPEFFRWANDVFCYDQTEERLVGSARDGWRVARGGFAAPSGAPEDDSPNFQAWLEGSYLPALTAWRNEYAPSN